MSVAALNLEYGQSPSGHHVLVVEDDAVCQDLMCLFLDRLGYSADVADNGVDALSAIRLAPYKVVFMDVRMPGMGGLEASRLIRTELDATSQPTIFAMSADSTSRCQEECRQAGMDGYLAKPVNFDQVAAVLDSGFFGRWEVDRIDELIRTAPTASATVVYDPGVLELLLADLDADESLRTELIESFISDSNDRLTAIVEAGRSCNLAALSSEAHAIKAAAAVIGLLALSDVACEIDASAKTMSTELDVQEEAGRLIAEYNVGIDAIRASRHCET
jgi:CheY-like chemotaxis protein/HPt (histidine-containing phosphotransfer) domain-containing protein